MKQTSLRVGVVGLGMGQVHIAGYQTNPRAEVVAIADPDAVRLQQTGDKYGVSRRYHTAQEMLDSESLDVVSVATPNRYHLPITLAALDAGCHVLCEKPMAMNADEALRMRSGAESRSRRLMINFSYRFTEPSMALKGVVDRGELGEIYFGRTVWHRRRGMPGFGGWFGQRALAGGGPLIDLGVHRLDLALWLMGYPRPAWIMGATYDHLATALAAEAGAAFDVEDLAAGMIRFAGGSSLLVEASWTAHIGERELMETRLYGTRAGLVQRNVSEGYQFEAEVFLERGGAHFDMKLHEPMPATPTPMSHFVDAILEGKPHIATAEEGVIVMQILDALYLSAAEGRPVQL
jgi:predicted dehydrogenase